MRPAKRSTTSWTSPKPGDVLNYAYLWHHEAAKGQTEGLKDRPCVVVISVSQEANGLNVIVCPVTSQAPENTQSAVEIPPQVKNHLNLIDRDKSYAITSEINAFIWPGPDLRPFDRQGKRDVYFGTVPGKLHAKIKEGVLTHAKSRLLKTTPRD